jgi:hypothetical protein
MVKQVGNLAAFVAVVAIGAAALGWSLSATEGDARTSTLRTYIVHVIGEDGIAYARCDKHDTLLSGGFSHGSNVDLLVSLPQDERTWAAWGIGGTVRAAAVCQDDWPYRR